jgi:hypothetical protein
MPTTYCQWTDDEDEEFDPDKAPLVAYAKSCLIQHNKLIERARIEARLVAIADKKKPPKKNKN